MKHVSLWWQYMSGGLFTLRMTSTVDSRGCLHEYRKTNEVRNGASVGRPCIRVFDLYMGM